MLSDWQVLASGDDAEPEPEPAPLMAKVVSAAEARQALERASGFRKAARVVVERQEIEDEAAAQQTWQQQKQTARQSWREEAEAVDAVCVETYKAVAFAQAVSVGQSRGTDWHGHAVAVAKGTKVKVRLGDFPDNHDLEATIPSMGKYFLKSEFVKRASK